MEYHFNLLRYLFGFQSHDILIHHTGIIQQGTEWKQMAADMSIGVKRKRLHPTVVAWLRSTIKGQGSMQVEPAYSFILRKSTKIPSLLGVRFRRKSDAMMFKLCWQGVDLSKENIAK